MARIIVTTEQSERPDAPVLLDEWVYPDHLSDDQSAAQLIERIGWAVADAYDVERAAAHSRHQPVGARAAASRVVRLLVARPGPCVQGAPQGICRKSRTSRAALVSCDLAAGSSQRAASVPRGPRPASGGLTGGRWSHTPHGAPSPVRREAFCPSRRQSLSANRGQRARDALQLVESTVLEGERAAHDRAEDGAGDEHFARPARAR